MMAAEDLLERESPPEVREAAKSFLTTIFEDREVPEGTRLQALLIIRKAEARKIAQPPAASTGERGLAYRIAQQAARNELRKKLEAKGLWPAPPGWDAHIMSPDWPGPDDEPFNPIGLADRIHEARMAYYETKKGPKDEN
jgi:hypothetical protein